MSRTNLFWLPSHSDFPAALKECRTAGGSPPERLRCLQRLSNHNLDFIEEANLFRTLRETLAAFGDDAPDLPRVRLALLGSGTLEHLLPSLHVAALRRGFLLDGHLGAYNQYSQELLDPASSLYAFKPDVVVLALHPADEEYRLPLDASESAVEAWVNQTLDGWAHLWSQATLRTGAKVIQATLVIPPLQVFGQMDALVAAAPSHLLARLNDALAKRAAREGVLLLDLEGLASRVGKLEWCNFTMWFHAKQAIPVAQAPLFGDTVARLVGAVRGFSKKCLAVDLDNTLWGGTIGDDGLTNIVLGQGHAIGEAFQAFQMYLKQLKERGVLLAVCSKNEEANARLPFEKHPDMILRGEDISIFVANWELKTANLERIASQLQIGLDSIVFFDDNAAERALVRQFLPAVAVPEVPADPAYFALCLSEAGYFESAGFTAEDKARAASYRTTVQQARLRDSPRDLDEFLKGLAMEMEASPFDAMGLSRIAQLINKSNQFNLTTRRYSEAQVKQWMQRPECVTLQVRLKDSFADHGMISVVMAQPGPDAPGKSLVIDTWLMSCRVLGRQVEEEVLNILVLQAHSRGVEWILGEFIDSGKNQLVREHYKRLGFEPVEGPAPASGSSWWRLNVNTFSKHPTHITCGLPERIL